MIILIIALAVILLLIIPNISVVQQSKAYVIERLGGFHTVWGVGIHFKWPFVDLSLIHISEPTSQEAMS